MENITEYLVKSSQGDRQAFERVYTQTYQFIKKLAAKQLAREASQNATLQPTMLVNEAYFKLVDQRKVDWQNRAHFFALATQMMKRVVLDYVRAQSAQKRGGLDEKRSFDETFHGEVLHLDERLLDLDQAIETLKKLDSRKAQVVEMRYFGGFSIEEIAEHLEISVPTVKRDWAFARAFLERALCEGEKTGN